MPVQRKQPRKVSTPSEKPEPDPQVKAVAEKLGETEAIPLRQITRMLQVISLEQIEAMIVEAQQIEADGGMMIADGSRPRSLGGIFFDLARKSMTGPQRRQIWIPNRKKKKPKDVAIISLRELMIATQDSLTEEKGEISYVKITVIGRPKRTSIKENVTIVVMTENKGPNALPKGLPNPPQAQNTYVVYIGSKQWGRVREAINDPEDQLIIEGYPQFSPQLKVMTVYAQMCTTRNLQRIQRENQRAEAEAQQV